MVQRLLVIVSLFHHFLRGDPRFGVVVEHSVKEIHDIGRESREHGFGALFLERLTNSM